ncbi:hypothetical protein FO059_15545 [Tomitella fengzijianii]|uniref:Uncharacterized protein n=1 Tax=Tomitella fengzijianii TaxID=2597660 RepID=A0A516X8N7_9ACTN|nr:hypothetical protein FO059_15545 [Tomitella fengzijianii]
MSGPGFAPPAAWWRALEAVARDLRCLRDGRDVDVDQLDWRLSVHDDYFVSIGWESGRLVGGFGGRTGLTMDASYGEAAVRTAESVQDHLAGYEFVQWPSRGRHLLAPRLHGSLPFWFDPHGDVTVAPIGELCEPAGRCPAAEAST